MSWETCERGEIEPEQAYELLKEFEDKIVAECTELIEAGMPTDADELTESESKSNSSRPLLEPQ